MKVNHFCDSLFTIWINFLKIFFSYSPRIRTAVIKSTKILSVCIWWEILKLFFSTVVLKFLLYFLLILRMPLYLSLIITIMRSPSLKKKQIMIFLEMTWFAIFLTPSLWVGTYFSYWYWIVPTANLCTVCLLVINPIWVQSYAELECHHKIYEHKWRKEWFIIHLFLVVRFVAQFFYEFNRRIFSLY